MKKCCLWLVIINLLALQNALSCTIFCFTRDGQTYFGNNEDYSNPDTEIRFYPAQKGKYAWVYLGFSDNVAQGGVNEKGLCWDWVAMKSETGWKFDKTKKILNGYPYDKMITECATVEEALNFYEKYNEPSFAHAVIFIADKLGNSVIIGCKKGKIFIRRNEDNLQAFGYGGQAVEYYFSGNPGERNIDYMAEALNKAHQEEGYPTQYSNIISSSDGKLYLYFFHDYCRYMVIDYALKLKQSYTRYKMRDLFDGTKSFPGMTLKKQDPAHCISKSTDGLTAYMQIYYRRQSPQNNVFILLFLIIYGLQTLFTLLLWPSAHFLKIMESKEKNEPIPKPELPKIWSFTLCIFLSIYLVVLINFKEAFQVGIPQKLDHFPLFLRLILHIPLVALIMSVPLLVMNINVLRQASLGRFFKWHFTLNTISYWVLQGLFVYWGFIRVFLN
ncbi:MAG TPA: hypothetical protein VIH57_11635 [Bacteroidales bacterium]